MSNRKAEISNNLQEIQVRIAKAAELASRKAGEITLVAVTKTFPVSDIEILYELGIRNFGENRDQEGSVKAPALPSDCVWHFQGQIQSNKLKSIVEWADVVHSIDDLSHARKLAALVSAKDIFIQVSLDNQPNRGGVIPDLLPEFLTEIQKLSKLRVLGLMAVAPLGIEPATAFEQLRSVQRNIRKTHEIGANLSAGMSGDFEAAIAQGATHIRIGSQILGVR
ncbi:MAG: YggS family pyridoxal phosphate-dependent enzyme [Actinobacteria bacterium]|nr:YggS family pyridoxal phosphate-dependent enzyme [Actinomycetota bacterium]